MLYNSNKPLESWNHALMKYLNAKPAVIIDEVPLYMRPDLLTISAKRMNSMEIIAVLEEWDDWIKVVNEKKEKTGWIQEESITYTTIDIAFALVVKRMLEEQDPEQKINNQIFYLLCREYRHINLLDCPFCLPINYT